MKRKCYRLIYDRANVIVFTLGIINYNTRKKEIARKK